MEFLLLIMKVIAIILGVTSGAFGMATLVASFKIFDDWKTTFTVVYALLGWFILGMCVASILG